jgi:hypothetical protein
VQFPPPLVGQVGGHDDQRAFDQAPEFEFLDEQPGHDGLASAGIIGEEEADARLGQQVVVDRVHLMREWIDLRHRHGKMRVVLERQANSVRFGGESEMRGIAIKSRQCTSRGDRDGAVKFLGLEQLGPETFGVCADSLHLDPTATRLRCQDFDRFGPMGTGKDSSLAQLVHNIVSGHNIPCRYHHK